MDKKNIEAIYPLTSMQKIFLLHSLQNPEHDLGFLHIQFNIQGKLDTDILKTSWELLINRHQTLRTAIYWEELEQPLQVVFRKVVPIWKLLDWRYLRNEQQNEKLLTYSREIKNKGIILSQAPLIFVTLIQKTDDYYHFICDCHHITLDGWSGYLLISELFQLYKIQLLGSQNRLASAFQYSDYVAWIQKKDLLLAENYWKKQLNGLTKNTLWPIKTNNVEKAILRKILTINSTLTIQIQQLCKKEKITQNIFFLGIWSLLLSVYNNEMDVVFGITLSGRSAPLDGIENAVGMFSNILPFRTKINNEEELIFWLQHLSNQQVNINNYDYVTLEQIQQWRRINIQTLFVFENYGQTDLSGVNSLAITDYKSGLTSNYPLTIAVKPGKQVELNLFYDTGYLSDEDAIGICDNYKKLLENCVSRHHQKIFTLLQEIKINYDNKAISVHDSVPQKRSINKPETITEKKIAQIWVEIIGLKKEFDISRDDNFFDLGGRSIMAALLVSSIKETFNVDLSIHQLFEYSTLEKLSLYIQSNQSSEIQSVPLIDNNKDLDSFLSLTSIQPKGKMPTLFCVPAAGSTALAYVNIANHLGMDQPVYSFNPIGLKTDEQPHTCIKEMAVLYIDEMKMLQPKGPYFLCGTCMGGHVAFEMAQQIKKQSNEKIILILLDPPPPYMPDQKRIKHFVNLFLYRLKRESLLHLLINIVVFRQYRHLKVKIEKKFFSKKKKLIDLKEAHFFALRNYIPKIYDDDISIFSCTENFNLEKERSYPFLVSWSSVTGGKLDYYEIDGSHVDILVGSKLTMLTEKLKDCLSEARTKFAL